MEFKIGFGNSIKRYFNGEDQGIRYSIVQNEATSEANDFVPYHALLTGNLLGVGNHRTLLYDMQTRRSLDLATKNYETFVTGFMEDWGWKKFAKKGIENEYRVRAGQVIQVKDYVIHPLITLVVNKAHMLNINKEQPDMSKFFIAVDKAFTHESHRSMYLAFKKYLFDTLTNINVIHVDSISRFCYKSLAIEPRKPKSIIEAKSMGKNLTIDVMKHLI